MKINYIIKNVLAFAITFLSVVAFGREKGTIDLIANAGGLTSIDIDDSTSQIIVSGISGGSGTYENQSATPCLCITFKHAVKDNCFVYADGKGRLSRKLYLYVCV